MGLVQLFGISLPAFFVQSNHGPYIHDLAIPATWRGFVARISPTTGWVLVACRERVLGIALPSAGRGAPSNHWNRDVVDDAGASRCHLLADEVAVPGRKGPKCIR